jgi:hypothetical protein
VFVCQLTDEVACEESEDCPEGQVCAADGECRDECGDSDECAKEQQCLDEVNICADEEELDEDGSLSGVAADEARDDDGVDDDVEGDDTADADVGDDDNAVADNDFASDDDGVGNQPNTGDEAGTGTSADAGAAVGPGAGGSSADSEADSGDGADSARVASKVFGPEGGSADLIGVQLEVPAGALTVESTLTVEAINAPPQPLPPAWSAAGAIFSISPHGQAFASDVIVRLPHGAPADQPIAVGILPDGSSHWMVRPVEGNDNGLAQITRGALSYYVVIEAPQFDLAACVPSDEALTVEYDATVAPDDASLAETFTWARMGAADWGVSNGELTMTTAPSSGIWFGKEEGGGQGGAASWDFAGNVAGNSIAIMARFPTGADRWEAYFYDGDGLGAGMYWSDGVFFVYGDRDAGDPQLLIVPLETEGFHTYSAALSQGEAIYAVDGRVLIERSAGLGGALSNLLVIGDGSGPSVGTAGTMIVDNVRIDVGRHCAVSSSMMSTE